MSKVIRKKHLTIIELLLEATTVVSRLIREEKKQDCFVLLADCQNSAVALGNHIEKLNGLNTKTVAALEQYCESLYQMSVALEDDNAIEDTEAALKNAAQQISDTYDEEFPDKLEVVFLPYKASMWDSLESVWKAARGDENCEAYVVPIPYYDLDESRNFKEMHYEGDLYPDYVPVTHYDDYDLEERHPDMIFIHNPYDEYNRVTSIAPEFYSSRIKDFTDKLVYIPYFVLSEINPNNQVEIEVMKHFCYLPGTMYADLVIVQSEDMRQIYINEYLKMARQQGASVSRKELEKRILGIGSPKLDKVHNIKKEDIDVPSDWLKIIEKPDGSWKKIIFYNTSLASFLQNSEQMLVKIEDVLRIFKENKDEVALLWRPHPLMRSTIESLRPKLRDKYKEIVKKYKTANWGIYDDTPDMDRAVILSDGYYGDFSSVIPVYQETGKPTMIQDAYSMEHDRKKRSALNYFAFIDINGIRWFSNLRYNGLYSINLDTDEVIFHGRFKGSRSDEKGLHSYVKLYQDVLVFFPQEGKNIDTYNLKTKEFSSYTITDWQANRGITSGVVTNEDKFLLFPRTKNLPVLEFDLKGKKVTKKFDLKESNAYGNAGYNDLIRNIYVLDNKAWFVIYGTNRVVAVDYNTGSEEIFQIEEASSLQYIGYYDNAFWLGENENIIRWRPDTNIAVRINNVVEKIDDKPAEVVSVVYGSESIYVLPVWWSRITKIGTKNLKTCKIDLPNMSAECVNDIIMRWRDIKDGKISNNYLEIPPVSTTSQVYINLENHQVITKELYAEQVDFPIIDFKKEKNYYENLNMDDFIYEILKNINEKKVFTKKTSGKVIYEKSRGHEIKNI